MTNTAPAERCTNYGDNTELEWDDNKVFPLRTSLNSYCLFACNSYLPIRMFSCERVRPKKMISSTFNFPGSGPFHLLQMKPMTEKVRIFEIKREKNETVKNIQGHQRKAQATVIYFTREIINCEDQYTKLVGQWLIPENSSKWCVRVTSWLWDEEEALDEWYDINGPRPDTDVDHCGSMTSETCDVLRKV